MPKCSGPTCGAEVVFVPSAKSGRPMVLDAKPRKGIILLDDGTYFDPEDGGQIIVDGRINHQPSGAVAAVVEVWTDHHATCPDFAKGWRP